MTCSCAQPPETTSTRWPDYSPKVTTTNPTPKESRRSWEQLTPARSSLCACYWPPERRSTSRTAMGTRLLMLACNAGHTVCVRLLLGAGAAVEAHDNEGLTPIMFAAQNGHDDIVRILMERGADPNASTYPRYVRRIAGQAEGARADCLYPGSRIRVAATGSVVRLAWSVSRHLRGLGLSWRICRSAPDPYPSFACRRRTSPGTQSLS